jgi:hypothetical protein
LEDLIVDMALPVALMDLKEMESDTRNMDWINLAWSRDKCRDPVSIIKNLQITEKTEFLH